jgi:hypothetical protein
MHFSPITPATGLERPEYTPAFRAEQKDSVKPAKSFFAASQTTQRDAEAI